MNRSTKLTINRPDPALAPLEIDLTLAHIAESKMPEIATASSGNAAYLMSVFGTGYSALSRAYGELYREVGIATVKSRKRRAVIILDLAPQIAKDRGLASARSPTGSEDVREAICYADSEFCSIEEYRASLEAAKELVGIKLQALKMAFYAVQSIAKASNSSAGNEVRDLGNPFETPMIESVMDEVMAEEPQQKVVQSNIQPTKRGFGTPR